MWGLCIERCCWVGGWVGGEHSCCSRGAGTDRTRCDDCANTLQAHKAASEAASARQELGEWQERVQRYKAGLAEQQAEAAAAREAEQHLQQQLAGEQRRSAKVRTGLFQLVALLCCTYRLSASCQHVANMPHGSPARRRWLRRPLS